jgi:hypothetical protein
VQAPSGREQRIKLWTSSRKRWTIQFEARDLTMTETLLAFWEARDGGVRAFRFKDWTEYTVTDMTLTPDGTPTVQLAKSYTSGGQTRTRNIYAPVSATVTLKKNGGALGGISVSYTTGVVTLAAVNSKSITAITQASSAVLTVGASHGFVVNDMVYISGVSGMTQINGLVGTVTATAASTITINVNSTTFTAYTSGGTAASYRKTTDTFTWSGQFDHVARFDQTQQEIEQIDAFVRGWNNIQILEVIG